MAQLTLVQRCEIQIGLSLNQSYSHIGDTIDKDKSVVSREIKRNSDARNGEYRAQLAQEKATSRHAVKNKKEYFTSVNKKYVEKYLSEKFSPEQIVGRATLDGIRCVSHETIYQYIWKDKKANGKLYKFLRNKGKRYRKRGGTKDSRGLIVGRVDISQRPAIVDRWHRFGDLEIDLVIGKNHKQALLTINDRATGMLFMGKVSYKMAIEIEKKAVELLEDWKPLIHTITSDNGKEFGNHAKIAEQLNLSFYFAKPYHSWQRGANENLNGLVRQYFPKNHDFTTITNDQILYVQNELNNRPRKRLGYKSPNEFFATKLDFHEAVAFIS
jgi:IS30 family transposase